MGGAAITSALIITLPWLAGGLTGVSILRAEERADRGDPFIAFGAGSALSLPLVGWLTWLVHEFWSINFSYMLVGLPMACALTCSVAILGGSKHILARLTPWQCIGAALLALQLLSCTWLAISLPLNGWDSLSHWGPQALLIAEQIEAPSTTPNIAHHSHPLTVSLVLAWGAVVKNQVGQENVLFNTDGIAWILCLVSVVSIIYGWAARYYQGRGLPLLCCYVTASLPLLQNHSALIGYSEIFVTLFFLIGTIYGCSAMERLSVINCTMLAAAIITLLYLRNTGLVFAAILVISVGMFLLWRLMKRGSLLFLLFCLGIALFAIVSGHGWMLEFRGLEYGFDVESGKIAIATFRHAFRPPGLDVIIDVFEMAFTKNVSFGVLGITTLISLSHFFFSRKSSIYSDKFLSTVWVFLLVVTIISLFLPHGLQHSMPNRDTYLSRSMLPFIMVSMLLVVATSARGVAAESNGVTLFTDRDQPTKP